MWKFQNFSIIHILREINVAVGRSSKTAIFAILGALNFVNLVAFQPSKMQKLIKFKTQRLEICKNGRFLDSRLANFDFTQNLSGRKIL